MALLMKAAAMLLVGLAAVSHLTLRAPGSSLAFADVARRLAEADTLSFRATMRLPDTKGTREVTIRQFFKAPGLVRAESSNGPVTVYDLKRDQALFLDPKGKKALRVNGLAGKKAEDEKPLQVLQRLRDLAKKDGKPAGKRTIGGVEAVGFRVKVDKGEMLIWADPETKLPVRVHMKLKVGTQELEQTLSDFKTGEKLPDDLFSLTPPKEYALARMAPKESSIEEDVGRVLRLYAEGADGRFPARLDFWADLDPKVARKIDKKKTGGVTDPERLQLAMSVVRLTIFLKEKHAYHYRPAGLKFGDRDKALFWHRPKGSETYRVLYGDLHTGELPADKLPKD